MKKNSLILLLAFCFLFSKGQSGFKAGIQYVFAGSTYYGAAKNNPHQHETELPVYSLKSSFGTGIKCQYFLKDKWAINLTLSYQQKGAMFDKGVYDFTPRYKFNYMDVGLGACFQTHEIFKKTRLYFGIGGLYSKLLNSYRVNNFESYSLTNDSETSDFGALADVGFNITRLERDVIQISIFGNTGFKNVFSGVLAENGQIGKNLLFGLKVGYLFGFKGKQ